eukprot:COSAG06_NODE_5438_length_3482_cov_1.605084_2_plen_133_part_00
MPRSIPLYVQPGHCLISTTNSLTRGSLAVCSAPSCRIIAKLWWPGGRYPAPLGYQPKIPVKDFWLWLRGSCRLGGAYITFSLPPKIGIAPRRQDQQHCSSIDRNRWRPMIFWDLLGGRSRTGGAGAVTEVCE